MKRRILVNSNAVSEIIGTALLLAIAVVAMSVVYIQVLSDPGPGPETFVTLIGKMDESNAVFEHRSGEIIDINSELIMDVYGERSDPMPLYNFLDNDSKKDGFWRIGETFFYPIEGYSPSDDVRIEATIVDKYSNSMVFWGRLKEGAVAPPFGRGGIWHFDEPDGWDDNNDTKEVLDSSGNGNHGSAVANANNTDDTAVIGRSGFFDGVDDYVEVPANYSLNITRALTVEAWLRPLEERTDIDTKDFGQAFAYNPEILNVKDNLYIVVGEGQNAQSGMVVTVNITPDGQVSLPLDDSFFNASWGQQPSIIKVSSTNDYAIYAIAYRGQNQVGKIQTIKINFNDGSIISGIDEWEFDSTNANLPYIINVSDTKFAIAYRGGHQGIIKTIEIDAYGIITKAPIAEYPFNSTAAYGPSIIKISDTIIYYAIVYKNSNNRILLQTISIEDNGYIDIVSNPIDEIDLGEGSAKSEGTQEQRIKIINVTGGYYGIIYSDNTDNGNIITVRINLGGDVSEDDGYVFPFTTDDNCMAPDIIKVTKNIYAITYGQTGGNPKGSLITICIEPNGEIHSKEVLSTNIGNVLKFYSPEIIHISNRVFVIVYMTGSSTGHPHKGMLTTILTQDLTSIFERGVVRAGAASVYAKWEKGSSVVKLLACINTSADSGEIITGVTTTNEWHYIVLTFDGSQMCLYNDASLMGHEDVGPSVYIPKSNLRFGNSFYGYLDEIAIFDRALTQQEIEDRFNSVINTNVDPIISPVMSSPLDITATYTGMLSLDTVELWYRWRKEVKDQVDSNTSHIDGDADKGTETAFTNAQDIIPDNDVMMIQEESYVVPVVDECHYVNGFEEFENDWTCTGSPPWLNNVGDGTISEAQNGRNINWFTFTNTTATGTSNYIVNLRVYTISEDGNVADVKVYIDTDDDYYVNYEITIENPTTGWYETGTISGLTSVDEFNKARVWFEYIKDGPGTPITIDAACLRIRNMSGSTSYNIDFEYRYNAVDYDISNAEVCIYVDSHIGAEDLLVNYWNTTQNAWVSLGKITGTGWWNFTAASLESVYNIQLVGGEEVGDAIQDIWYIDVIMLHTWDSYNDWMNWNEDTSPSWGWSFNFPDGLGYYEFYSVGKCGVIVEAPPLSADTACLYIQ